MTFIRQTLFVVPLFFASAILSTTPGLFGFGQSSLAHAACTCKCVLGNVVPVCDSAMDIRPFCAPRMCPVVDPNKPIPQPKLGAAPECTQERVWNPYTAEYDWRAKC